MRSTHSARMLVRAPGSCLTRPDAPDSIAFSGLRVARGKPCQYGRRGTKRRSARRSASSPRRGPSTIPTRWSLVAAIRNGAVLALTDAPDTLLSVGQIASTASLGGVDSADALAASGLNVNGAALATTDSPDTCIAAAAIAFIASLNALDVNDSLSAAAFQGGGAFLAVTDSPDVVVFPGQISFTASSSTTDAPDVASVNVHDRQPRFIGHDRTPKTLWLRTRQQEPAQRSIPRMRRTFATRRRKQVWLASLDAIDSPDICVATAAILLRVSLLSVDAADTLFATGNGGTESKPGVCAHLTMDARSAVMTMSSRSAVWNFEGCGDEH